MGCIACSNSRTKVSLSDCYSWSELTVKAQKYDEEVKKQEKILNAKDVYSLTPREQELKSFYESWVCWNPNRVRGKVLSEEVFQKADEYYKFLNSDMTLNDKKRADECYMELNSMLNDLRSEA